MKECSSDPGSEPTKESYRADDQIDLSFRKSHIHFIYYTIVEPQISHFVNFTS